MESHAGLCQAGVFGNAVVDLKADVAEAWLGDGTKRGGSRDVRAAELEDLDPSASETQKNQPSGTLLEAESGGHFRGIILPGEITENLGMKPFGVKCYETWQIAGCDTNVMKAQDHCGRLADRDRTDDRK